MEWQPLSDGLQSVRRHGSRTERAKCLLEEPLEPIGVEPDAAGERVKAVFGHKLECGVPHVYVYQLSERYINAQMVND